MRAHREVVLTAAYAAHPERFVNRPPRPADLPTAVWINPPVRKPTAQDAQGAANAKPDDLQHGRIIDASLRSTTLVNDRSATPLINLTSVSQCH